MEEWRVGNRPQGEARSSPWPVVTRGRELGKVDGMTENELKELRKRIEKAPRNQRGRRQYGPELRRNGLRYAEEHLAEGASVGEVASALGVKAGTLQTWLKSEERRKRGMRSVRVVEEGTKERGGEPQAPGRGAVMVLANGARIEGLTMRELIELTRGLA
jgi:transposase-like protein